MKNKIFKNIKVPVVFVILYIVLFFGCNNNESVITEIYKTDNEKTENIKPAKAEEYAVEAPPFSDGIFPCTDCHANFAPNPLKRKLVEWHDDISAIFNHDSENR